MPFRSLVFSLLTGFLAGIFDVICTEDLTGIFDAEMGVEAGMFEMVSTTRAVNNRTNASSNNADIMTAGKTLGTASGLHTGG